MKKFPALFVALLSVVTATSSFSFAATPQNLSWKTMPLVTFGYTSSKVKNDSKQQAEVKGIWGQKLQSGDIAFVLVDRIETEKNQYILTSLDSARMDSIGECEAPPNGDGTAFAQPLYSKCNLRVIQINKATGKKNVQTIQNFCHLSDPDNPGGKDRTEYALDAKNKMVYFRTIMYGKHASECDRSIRVE